MFIQTEELEKEHNYTFDSKAMFDNDNVTDKVEKELVESNTRSLFVI